MINQQPATQRPTSLFALGILSLAAVLAGTLVLGSVACSRDALQKGLGGPSTPDELLADLRQEKTRLDQATDSMMKRIDEFNAGRQPGETTIQFSEIFYDDLNGDQRDILNSLLEEEKDVSYRSLLSHLIQDREAIRGLQEKVLHLEQTLPDRFVIARKGDSHHELAMEYLVNEAKLEPEKAKELLKQSDQTDELLPGNQVWFFYDAPRDAFRTYVTQGEAKQTPLVVRRAMQRKVITERDEALAREVVLSAEKSRLESDVATLNADVSALGERRAQLESEVATLNQNKVDLQTDVARLEGDLAFRKNSLFYHAANEQSLREQGVLSSVLKRVKDVKPVQYEQALDLRQATTINLDPRPFGLDRIKGVKLLPGIFQEGRDFTVETMEDGSAARIDILDPEIFRGKEVIVSVRG